jgi:hypothetical protein
LRTVRRWDGLSRANVPGGAGCSSPSITSRGGAGEHEEQLFLVAFCFIVLGNRPAGWDLDEVDAERPAVK